MNYPTPLVSCSWLASHLGEADIAIADCRFSLMEPDAGRQTYASGHIPGACYLDLNRDLSSPLKTHGGRHPLPDPKSFSQTLSTLGVISGRTFVVAYDDSRFAFASRLWWLLRYFGHDRVAVLDGGFQAWKAAGLPVTDEIPSTRSGHFDPQVRSPLAVTIDDVKARSQMPGVVLVDAREGDRYRGEREPIDPIAGHIPGAVNVFWKDTTDDQGMAQPPGVLRSQWQPYADADEIIVYCGSGVTACVNLLALELAGITTGKLYPGSWSDWCSYLV
jgi:thiosulfate/3-mercaptopyruvate sulfurtransferase